MYKVLMSAALVIGAATPAFAQEAAAPAAATTAIADAAVKAGDTVYDPAGNVVGTIQAVSGPNASLATGNVTVGIPLAGIGPGEKGPTIALTKEQLEARAKQPG